MYSGENPSDFKSKKYKKNGKEKYDFLYDFINKRKSLLREQNDE